jgi:hypothetical protein
MRCTSVLFFPVFAELQPRLHTWPAPFTSPFIQPLCFQTLTHSFAQRTAHICFPFNHFRTLSIATGGVGGAASFFDVRTFRPADVPTCFRPIPFLFKLFRTLLHLFALFCTHAKLNSFRFKQFRTLSQKHRGYGGGRCYHRALRAARRHCFLCALRASRRGRLASSSAHYLITSLPRYLIASLLSQNGPVPLAPHGTGYLLLGQEAQNSLEARLWNRPGRQQPISARGRQTSWQR